MEQISSIDGSEVVSEPAGNKLSQNDVVFSTMMKYIDTIESTISKEGLMKDVGSLVRNALNGYRESEKALKADTLINLGVHDLLIKDIYEVAAKIVAKNAEIQHEIDQLTVHDDSPDAKRQTEENIRNSEKLKTLQEELNALRERRDIILNGDNNWKYVGQAIFASNTELAKNFIDLSIERYSQVTLGREYISLTDDEKTALQQRYEEYMHDEGKNKVLRAFDLYLGLSQRYAERLKQENEVLKDHPLDETRKVNTRFQTDFLQLLQEYHKTSTEYGQLKAKENKTEEEIAQKCNLKESQKENITKMSKMNLKTGKAYRLKLAFQDIYNMNYLSTRPPCSQRQEWRSIEISLIGKIQTHQKISSDLSVAELKDLWIKENEFFGIWKKKDLIKFWLI